MKALSAWKIRKSKTVLGPEKWTIYTRWIWTLTWVVESSKPPSHVCALCPTGICSRSPATVACTFCHWRSPMSSYLSIWITIRASIWRGARTELYSWTSARMATASCIESKLACWTTQRPFSTLESTKMISYARRHLISYRSFVWTIPNKTRWGILQNLRTTLSTASRTLVSFHLKDFFC